MRSERAHEQGLSLRDLALDRAAVRALSKLDGKMGMTTTAMHSEQVWGWISAIWCGARSRHPPRLGRRSVCGREEAEPVRRHSTITRRGSVGKMMCRGLDVKRSVRDGRMVRHAGRNILLLRGDELIRHIPPLPEEGDSVYSKRMAHDYISRSGPEGVSVCAGRHPRMPVPGAELE